MKKLAPILICIAWSLLTGIFASGTAWAGAWPEATIGAGFGVQVKPERTSDDELRHIKDTGFNYLRFDIHWRDAERQRGRYDWSSFDGFIARMRAQGLKAIVILNGGNPIYSGNVAVPPDKAFGFSSAPKAPTSNEDVQAFAAFAAAAVARYGTNDIIWEIWNEPDNLAFWPPEPDAVAFAKLASATCEAIRSAAPDATIVAPGFARLPAANDPPYSDFLKELLHSPASTCLNALSIHPYRLTKAPETVIGDYQTKVRPFIASQTPQGAKPLNFISGEWGYPTNKISAEQQADYLLRMHLANLLSGVPLSIWYEWKDSRPGPAPDDMEAHFGVVDYDGKNKPAATAISQLLPKIKNATIDKRLPDPNVNCFIVRLNQADGRHQLLAWIENDQMSGDNMLVIGRKAAKRFQLTQRPQLFDEAPDGAASCR